MANAIKSRGENLTGRKEHVIIKFPLNNNNNNSNNNHNNNNDNHNHNDNRDFKITTTATATGTSLNKRFNEQNNGSAPAL